jgi:uncharacterized protein (TIGR03435 family)
MSSDERRLNELVDRDLPWPTQMEFVASRDRVLDQLRATPQRQVPRVPEVSKVPEVPGVLNRGSVVRVAAAAALVIVAVGGAIIWPRGVRVYAAGNDGLQVTLSDDSRVEMRAHSEMTVGRASDGIQIDLKKGDIIVTAAKPRKAPLYVRTMDMIVAVNGTVLLVNAGPDGSRVGVIEGEVRVQEAIVETRLGSGEQVATSPTIAQRPLAEDISWSRNANAHLSILESFKRGIAKTAGTLTPAATPGQAAAAAGQPVSLEFEEASIRECDPDNLPPAPAGARGGGANSFLMTPGRLHALCLSVATLIRTAYGYGPVANDFMSGDGRGRGLPASGVPYGLGVEDGLRVRGGPDWVRSERYTIEAVADPSADGPTMSRTMLLALLERRFKLRAHVETEQVPAYALVVAPGGLKIRPSEQDSCISYPADPTVPRINGVPIGARRPMLADVRRGEKRVCGQLPERNGPNQVFVAGSSTFGVLAQQLAARLGRVRVYDKTGITDPFDWILEFAPNENPSGPANMNPQTAPEPADVPRGPTIFIALEEQLGLRLEPARQPREYIEIDAVERPAPN